MHVENYIFIMTVYTKNVFIAKNKKKNQKTKNKKNG